MRILHDDPGWLAIRPLTVAGVRSAGRATRWCTSAVYDNQFRHYYVNSSFLSPVTSMRIHIRDSIGETILDFDKKIDVRMSAKMQIAIVKSLALKAFDSKIDGIMAARAILAGDPQK